MENQQDRIEGVVCGTAIGDALGYPVEFLDIEAIRKRHGRVLGFVELRVMPGRPEPVALYSDDTQMFIAVAEGLLRARTQSNLDEAAYAVAEELVRWADSPENNRAPGGACMLGCRNLAMGMDWRSAGKRNGGGCGAAMRSMAQGIWQWEDPCQAAYWAGEMALMTHRLPMAQASAAAVAAIVAALLCEAAPLEAAERGIQAAERYDAETARMLRQAVERAVRARQLMAPRSKVIEAPTLCGLGTEVSDILAGVLNQWRGWSGHEAVAASLFCFLTFQESFSDTVIAAVNSSGDSDSLGAIAGAFSGAYLGAGKIPIEWRENVENATFLHELSNRLADYLQKTGSFSALAT
jgi:ADP-ribosylglycohydrolase